MEALQPSMIALPSAYSSIDAVMQARRPMLSHKRPASSAPKPLTKLSEPTTTCFCTTVSPATAQWRGRAAHHADVIPKQDGNGAPKRSMTWKSSTRGRASTRPKRRHSVPRHHRRRGRRGARSCAVPAMACAPPLVHSSGPAQSQSATHAYLRRTLTSAGPQDVHAESQVLAKPTPVLPVWESTRTGPSGDLLLLAPRAGTATPARDGVPHYDSSLADMMMTINNETLERGVQHYLGAKLESSNPESCTRT